MLLFAITLCMGGWYSWMNELIYIWMTWSIYEWADLYMNELIDLYLWCSYICLLLDCWRFGKGLCCEVQRTLHPVKKRSNEKWWDDEDKSRHPIYDRPIDHSQNSGGWWSIGRLYWWTLPFVEGTLTLLVSVRMNIDGSTYTVIPPSQDYISLIAISKLSLISHDMMHTLILTPHTVVMYIL